MHTSQHNTTAMDSRDPSMDSSRPLNPKDDLEMPPPGARSPDMEYGVFTLGPERFQDDSRTKHGGLTLVMILRFFSIIFTFSGVIVQLCAEPRHGTHIMMIILTFVTMFWNILSMMPTKLLDPSKNVLGLPEISCTLGSFKFYYCGASDEDDYMNEAVSPKKSAQVGFAVVDGFLASLSLLFGILGADHGGWWGSKDAVYVLYFFVVAFQYLIFVASHFAVCGPVSITIKVGRANQNYRIRLPQDIETAQPTNAPISVTA